MQWNTESVGFGRARMVLGEKARSEDVAEKLAKLVAALEDEKGRLEVELHELDGKMAAGKEELQRIVVAIEALKGAGKTGGTQAITQRELLEHLSVVRSEKPQADEAELKAEVEKRLRAAGRTLTGFGMLFKRALKVKSA